MVSVNDQPMPSTPKFDTIKEVIEAMKEMDEAYKKAVASSKEFERLINNHTYDPQSEIYRKTIADYANIREIKSMIKYVMSRLNVRLLELCANNQ